MKLKWKPIRKHDTLSELFQMVTNKFNTSTWQIYKINILLVAKFASVRISLTDAVYSISR